MSIKKKEKNSETYVNKLPQIILKTERHELLHTTEMRSGALEGYALFFCLSQTL